MATPSPTTSAPELSLLQDKWAHVMQLIAAAAAASSSSGSSSSSNITTHNGKEQPKKQEEKHELLRIGKDIKALAEAYSRMAQEKDNVAHHLQAELVVSEGEMEMAKEVHLRQREALLQFHQAHTSTLQQSFNNDLQTLQDDFQKEKTILTSQERQEEEELLNLVQEMEAYNCAQGKKRGDLQEQLRKVLRKKSEEELTKLRVALSTQIDKLAEQLEGNPSATAPPPPSAPPCATSSSLQLPCTTVAAEGKSLVRKDQHLTTQIETKVQQVAQQLQRWREWKVKMTTTGKEHSERNQSLWGEKRVLSEQYRKLKAHMNKYRQEQQQDLVALSEAANVVQERLEAHVELGLRVLGLAERAHKREQEQEKLSAAVGISLPQYTPPSSPPPTPSREEFIQSEGPLQAKPTQTSAWRGGAEAQQQLSMVEHWRHLDNFWTRYNQALLGKLNLQKRREALQEENAMLQATIEQYLDSGTVNDAILKRRTNPSLIVEAKPLYCPPQAESPQRRPHPTVIEGNHMLQTGRVNTVPFV